MTFSEKTVKVDDPSYIKLKFKPDEIKNVTRSNLRMPRADERYLVSARGSPVAQYYQVTLIQVESADDEEWESLDITNMSKDISTLKREILKILGKNLAHAGDYRMRKITSPDVFKIKHDHDVINLKHNDKVEIVHESDKKSNVAAYFNIYN